MSRRNQYLLVGLIGAIAGISTLQFGFVYTVLPALIVVPVVVMRRRHRLP
jgi:hypothetical protein